MLETSDINHPCAFHPFLSTSVQGGHRSYSRKQRAMVTQEQVSAMTDHIGRVMKICFLTTLTLGRPLGEQGHCVAFRAVTLFALSHPHPPTPTVTSGMLLGLPGTHGYFEELNSRIHSTQPPANSATSLDSNPRVCSVSLNAQFLNLLA